MFREPANNDLDEPFVGAPEMGDAFSVKAEVRAEHGYPAGAVSIYTNLLKNLKGVDPDLHDAIVSWVEEGQRPDELDVNFLWKEKWLVGDASRPRDEVYQAIGKDVPTVNEYDAQIKSANKQLLANLKTQRPNLYQALLDWADTGVPPKSEDLRYPLESEGWIEFDNGKALRPVDAAFEAAFEQRFSATVQTDADLANKLGFEAA
jgi:hypothetical protein